MKTEFDIKEQENVMLKESFYIQNSLLKNISCKSPSELQEVLNSTGVGDFVSLHNSPIFQSNKLYFIIFYLLRSISIM